MTGALIALSFSTSAVRMPPSFGIFEFLADPDAVVDDAAEVLGEMAVDLRRDAADGLAEQHFDAAVGRGEANERGRVPSPAGRVRWR